ncbi:MAG: hypothetical protein IKU30_03060 [Clostridia bacterium]|nr:hypothetical protein [Clostridia bacterium]
MKNFKIFFVVACVLLLTVTGAFAISGAAEKSERALSEDSIPEGTLITYGYLEQFREELKQEILNEIAANGGSVTVESIYKDISLTSGQTLILSPETEIIYRGGGAVAITSSNDVAQGLTDMSASKEIFSGKALEYGHIYFASASDSKKAILVTGDKAYFTVRGDYDIV